MKDFILTQGSILLREGRVRLKSLLELFDRSSSYPESFGHGGFVVNRLDLPFSIVFLTIKTATGFRWRKRNRTLS
jgi:hypothetical protein